MALVRILVDGYSLLHNSFFFAVLLDKLREAARDELMARLTQFIVASGTPITIFFNGFFP